MQIQEELSRGQEGAGAKSGPYMSQQEGISGAGAGFSGAGASATYQSQAQQIPSFSKEGAGGQERREDMGATSGVNIETNVPLTSTGEEGTQAQTQDRAGARGGVYTEEIQITNFTFMPEKNLLDTMGLGGLGFGAGAQQRQGIQAREQRRSLEGVGRMGKELRQDLSKAKENLQSKVSHIQKDILTQVRHARYGIMSFLGFFFIAFLLVTGPIWMTLLIFNLPVIVASYFAFFYTNVIMNQINYIVIQSPN